MAVFDNEELDKCFGVRLIDGFFEVGLGLDVNSVCAVLVLDPELDVLGLLELFVDR